MKTAPFIVPKITFWVALALFGSLPAQLRFVDIAKEKRVQGLYRNGSYVYGHGVAIADISGDELPDIYMANAMEGVESYPDMLYISQRGKSYTNEAYGRGVEDNYGIGSHGVVFFDFDNDGDFDLYNASTSQPQDGVFAINRLYMNNGGSFQDWTSRGKLSDKPVGSRSVVVLDINLDGYMDIYSIGSILPNYDPENNQLYINQGDRTFKLSDMGLAAVNKKGWGPNGVTAADVNGDGYPEIYISRVDRANKGARPANQFFFRQADGTFVDRVNETNTQATGWSDGATFADFDTDGDLDLFVSSSNSKKLNKLYVFRNDGLGNFTDITEQINIYQRAFSNVLFDVDNDGDLDLYAMSDSTAFQHNRLYLNDGHGNFTMQSNTGLEVPYHDARGAGVADVNNDGLLDLYVTDKNKDNKPYCYNHLFRNETPDNGNKWLKIFGRGPKGDAGAFGTKIWIFKKGGMDDISQLICHKEIISNYGFCCSDDPVQHFGVGKRDTVAVKIRLTDGTLLKYDKVATNQKITFAKPGSIVKTSGDDQSGARNTTLPLPLKVTVLDVGNNPVMGTEVRFTSNDGQIVGTQPLYTDMNGQAQVQYIVGNTAPVQKVTVSSPLMANIYTEFTVNMIVVAKELRLISLPNLAGTAGETLADSIRVRVLDDQGLGKSNQAVTFSILDGQGRLFPGGALSAQVQTNSAGFAGVAWKLGKAPAAFVQHLSIQSLYGGDHLSGSPCTVSAAVQYPDTLKLEKIDGDSQSGAAGRVLAQPLRVKVSSTTGVAPPPLAVRFRVTSGAGRVSEADSVTVTADNGGLASVPWRLGVDFHLAQTVLAYLVVNPAHRQTFSATALPVASRLLYSGESEYSGVAGRLLATPLKVKITDDSGTPIPNFTVMFKIVKGSGKINALDSSAAKTDGNGEATATWLLGAKAGRRNNHVRITAAGLNGSPVDVYASALAGPAYQVKQIAGDNQTAGPLRSLMPLQVQVTDSLQNPVSHHPVRFNIVQGDAKFGSNPSLTTETDSSGVAFAVVTMSLTPGPVQIQSTAEHNGISLKGSPISFRATLTPPVATQLVYTGLREMIGQAGKTLPEIVVQARDDVGVPVSGCSVLFKVTLGSGKVNNSDSVRLKTDQQGNARVVWSLGQISGKRNNQLQISASGLTGSPLQLIASATSGRAYRIEKTSGDAQVGTPHILLSLPFLVSVTDSLRNPVAGQSVLYQVTQGDATFSARSQIAMLTDSLGQARAVLQLGEQIGTVQVKVSAQYGGRELENSPLFFTATVRPPNPTLLKLIGPAEYVGQAGRALSQPVRAQVLDEFGYPVSGFTVTARVLKGDGQLNHQDSIHIKTDQQGYVSCQWRLGMQPGQKNNQMMFAAAALKGSPVLITATGLAPKAYRMSIVGGDAQSGAVLTTLAQPLQVQITDSLHYPVADQSVSFQIVQGDANLAGTTAMSVQSDSNGIAHAVIGLGTIPGLIQIQAVAHWNGQPLRGAPVTFSGQLVLPSIDPARSVLIADSVVVADGQARARLQALLVNSQNQPLAGLHIRFDVFGKDNHIAQPVLPTDAQGITEGYLTSTKAEVKKVWAVILYGTTVLDTIRIRFAPGAAASLQKAGGDNQSAPVRMTLANPLNVLLSDAFGNPLGGVLTVEEVWPDGTRHAQALITTDQNGVAQWRWTLGALPGSYSVHVAHNQLRVTFVATASARVPGRLQMVTGNDQYGRSGAVLAQALVVQVFDSLGEPLPGVPLTFSVSAGGGMLMPPAGVVSDSLGKGRVTWKVGVTGEQRVQVRIAGVEQQVVEFTARLKANSVPTLQCLADTTISEGQFLSFIISGFDADGDSLRFGADVLPDNAVFDPALRQFSWTPGYRHAGTSKIAFWVQDSYGSRTVAITSITVRDVPMAPYIVAYMPADSMLNMANEDLAFSVSADDPDGNHLYYSWWLNGNMVSPGGNEFLLRYRPTLPLQSRLVVRVSDGQFTVEQSWRLNLASSVAGVIEPPTEFALLQNYPNPFNPVTRIPFQVAHAATVRIVMYDSKGQRVRTLTDAYYPAGRYEVEWNTYNEDGTATASGVYVCVLECEGFRQTRKVLLMK